MLNRNTIAAISAVVFFSVASGFCETLEENWNDFLHYTVIGRLDLAEGFGQKIVHSEPDSLELLELSESNPRGYAILLRVQDSNIPLGKLAGRMLDIIEQGRYLRRTEAKIIVEEIKRLSSTTRGRIAAVERLKNSGEYAIVYMLDAMANPERQEELPNIVWALGQMGRASIRPLVAALQTNNVAIKGEIIKALGEIRYPQAAPYLKYIIETSESKQLRGLARKSIGQIDPTMGKLPAAELFFSLGESYYNHADSLAPAADYEYANIWFWDTAGRRIVRLEVDKRYFNELMAMRACEWALKADMNIGKAISLWLTAFFKSESTGLRMPEYFGAGHADASTYATTTGVEYLHEALSRAIKDKNAFIALKIIKALEKTAGEKSLFYGVGTEQPLVQALSFDDRAVRYSAAIVIASACPKEQFDQSVLVVETLIEAIQAKPTEDWDQASADSYAQRSVKVMLQLAQRQNKVIDLSKAQPALIKATREPRKSIRILAGRILAWLGSPDAQQAIAEMALDEDNDMELRISAFDSLADSAKINASLLDDNTLDVIYSLISSEAIPAELRSHASAAYGALNLPSRKVKNLILDQVKS